MENDKKTDKEENSNSQFSKLFDSIGKEISIGYVFLVFCGALYFHFYYNTFHIDIFRYLDLSEIAVSFLPIIIIIIIFFGFIICYFPLVDFLVNLTKGKEEKFKFIKWFKKNNFINKYLSDVFTILLCLICGIYLYLSYHFLDNASDAWKFSKYGEIWWLVLIIPSVLLFPLAIKPQNIIINFAIIIIMSVVHQSIRDVHKTIDDAKIRNTVYTIITSENDTIITNRNHYFVGRTHNYIFLYNTETKSYDDLPLAQIKKISFTNK